MGTILVAVAAGVVAGIVGWAAARSRPDLPAPSTQPPARVEVTAGEAVVWSGGASSRAPVLVSAGRLLVAAVGAVLAPPEARTVLIVVLPLVALALTTFGQIRATVGPAPASCSPTGTRRPPPPADPVERE